MRCDLIQQSILIENSQIMNIGKLKSNGADGTDIHDFLFGCATKQGKMILPVQYDAIYDFHDGIALVKKNGKYFYIKENGEPLTPKITITKMEDLLTLPKNCCIEHTEIGYGLDFQGNIITFNTVEQREDFIKLLDNTINDCYEDSYSKKLCKKRRN